MMNEHVTILIDNLRSHSFRKRIYHLSLSIICQSSNISSKVTVSSFCGNKYILYIFSSLYCIGTHILENPKFFKSLSFETKHIKKVDQYSNYSNSNKILISYNTPVFRITFSFPSFTSFILGRTCVRKLIVHQLCVWSHQDFLLLENILMYFKGINQIFLRYSLTHQI